MKASTKPQRWTRRHFMAAAAALGGASSAAGQTPALPRAERMRASLPKPNGLNLIVIVADTTRCDHLGIYGSKRVRTPNLDRLAAEAVVLENAYADGLPTIPCRRVFHTGRSILREKQPWWHPLSREDITLAEILKKAQFGTGLIADTYHYFKPEMNFHRGFDSWQWIRGQEFDNWITGPRDQFDPARHMPAHLINEQYRRQMLQYMLNTSARKAEEDYFCAQSCRAAMEWLERNAKQKPFLLWLDMFDPHEPWDAPPRFQKMYRSDYGYERYLFGYGVRNKDIVPNDYPVLRDLYAAEVTFSDHWIGQLLEKIDRLGLRDDTVVVFMSDHGTHLGELDCVQKTAGLLNSCVAHIPFVVRHPDRRFAGRRLKNFVSTVDYLPTFLDLMGLGTFPGLDGASFWPQVVSAEKAGRDRLFMGFDGFAAVRDRRWHYFQHYEGNDRGKGPALYDLEKDPGEEHNVAALHPEVVAEKRALLEERFSTPFPVVDKV